MKALCKRKHVRETRIEHRARIVHRHVAAELRNYDETYRPVRMKGKYNVNNTRGKR